MPVANAGPTPTADMSGALIGGAFPSAGAKAPTSLGALKPGERTAALTHLTGQLGSFGKGAGSASNPLTSTTLGSLSTQLGALNTTLTGELNSSLSDMYGFALGLTDADYQTLADPSKDASAIFAKLGKVDPATGRPTLGAEQIKSLTELREQIKTTRALSAQTQALSTQAKALEKLRGSTGTPPGGQQQQQQGQQQQPQQQQNQQQQNQQQEEKKKEEEAKQQGGGGGSGSGGGGQQAGGGDKGGGDKKGSDMSELVKAIGETGKGAAEMLKAALANKDEGSDILKVWSGLLASGQEKGQKSIDVSGTVAAILSQGKDLIKSLELTGSPVRTVVQSTPSGSTGGRTLGNSIQMVSQTGGNGSVPRTGVPTSLGPVTFNVKGGGRLTSSDINALQGRLGGGVFVGVTGRRGLLSGLEAATSERVNNYDIDPDLRAYMASQRSFILGSTPGSLNRELGSSPVAPRAIVDRTPSSLATGRAHQRAVTSSDDISGPRHKR